MERRPLKIVMLTTVRLHQSKGGSEKVMIDTANALVSRGHEVTIIFRDKKGSLPGFKLDKKVELVNCASVIPPFLYSSFVVDLRSFSFSRKNKNYKRAKLNLKTTAYRFREAIQLHPADIYITYDPKLSAMLVQEFNIPKPVVTTFQFDPEHIIKRYYFEAIKDLIAQAGPIQVLLPQFETVIKRFIPKATCITIPNAVPKIEQFATLNSKIILNVGRVMPLKNQHLLVETMILLQKKFPEWKLKIVGENDVDFHYTDKIKSIVSTNGLERVVELCGPTNEIAKVLQTASIFVFPSISEGFGLALAEAMAMGIPSVGLKDCSAVSYLIKHGENGLLCDNNPESMAEALALLIQDEELRTRLGRQARLDIRNYSPERIWDKWEDLLYSLVEK